MIHDMRGHRCPMYTCGVCLGFTSSYVLSVLTPVETNTPLYREMKIRSVRCMTTTGTALLAVYQSLNASAKKWQVPFMYKYRMHINVFKFSKLGWARHKFGIIEPPGVFGASQWTYFHLYMCHLIQYSPSNILFVTHSLHASEISSIVWGSHIIYMVISRMQPKSQSLQEYHQKWNYNSCGFDTVSLLQHPLQLTNIIKYN